MATPYTPRGMGEPLELRGGAMYFTSWKYVRQGGWCWPAERVFDPTDPLAPIGEQVEQGGRPSRYQPRNLPRGLRLVAQKAQKIPQAFRSLGTDGRDVGVYTVLEDGGRYRMWYVIRSDRPAGEARAASPSRLALAESTDGLNWRPVKDGECQGLVRGFGEGSIFLDPSSSDERYKMIHGGTCTDAEMAAWEAKYPGQACPMARRADGAGQPVTHALFGAVSPDGVRWRSLDEPLMVHFADTRNTCYYDLDRRKYVAYVRIWEANPQPDDQAEKYTVGWGGVGRRSIGRAVSDDFRHFSKAEIVIATSADMAPSHLWYNNAKTTLPRCPDQHILLPWRWEMERDGGDSFLFSTSDGWAWSQVPGGPVLECGPVGSPDGEYVVFTGGMIELADGRWAVPYHGWAIPHKYPGQNPSQRKGLFPGVPNVTGYAVWPKGRLVALECADGEFATVAVVPPGDRIRLNASIRPAGHIQVAVQQLRRDDIIPGRDFADCDTLVGDSAAMPVTWKGEALLKHGCLPVILKFRLRHAKLFGVEFF